MIQATNARRVYIILVALFTVVLCWRILALGFGHHYGGHLEEDRSATQLALAWSPRHAEALASAAYLAGDTPLRARELLNQAIASNPADGAAVLALAWQWLSEGKTALGDEAVELAANLKPSEARLRLEAGNYWLARERWDHAVAHWSVAIEAKPTLSQQLFPVLLAVAENGATLPILKPLIADPPLWWGAFFHYAIENAIRLQTIRELFALRREATSSISLEERRLYIERLKSDEQWGEAYVAWLNSLTPEQLQRVGPLFNGGFEDEITNTGFDWHIIPSRNVLVETARTYGIAGERALHLVFREEQLRSQHLYQPLLLAPGGYQLVGRVRPDSLQGETGELRWQIVCRNGSERRLADSERFLGLDQWRTFNLEFDVPEDDCSAQDLQLVTAGVLAAEHGLRGDIWFDDLRIHRLEKHGGS